MIDDANLEQPSTLNNTGKKIQVGEKFIPVAVHQKRTIPVSEMIRGEQE